MLLLLCGIDCERLILFAGGACDVRIYAPKDEHPAFGLAPASNLLLSASPCSASQYARVRQNPGAAAAPGCPITLNLAVATNGEEKVAAHRMINGRAYRQENNKSIRRAEILLSDGDNLFLAAVPQ